jgi:hypothetical protein
MRIPRRTTIIVIERTVRHIDQEKRPGVTLLAFLFSAELGVASGVGTVVRIESPRRGRESFVELRSQVTELHTTLRVEMMDRGRH